MDNSKPIKMTKNEYNEFLRKNAERLQTDADYNLQDFNRDADSAQVLGFNLDNFKFSDVERQIIDKMFDAEDRDKNGNLLLRGHVIDRSFVNMIANTLGCRCDCDKHYNGFYSNSDKYCILEFCEGDISLTICETSDAYYKACETYYTFYGLRREDVCLKVYFDDIHIDDVFVPKDKAEETIASILKYGYADYNADVKEDYKKMTGSNPNPVVSVQRDDSCTRITLDNMIGEADAGGMLNKSSNAEIVADRGKGGVERLTLASLIQRAEKLAEESNALKDDLKAFKDKNAPTL